MLTSLQNQQFHLWEFMPRNIWANVHIEKTITALLIVGSWKQSICNELNYCIFVQKTFMVKAVYGINPIHAK